MISDNFLYIKNDFKSIFVDMSSKNFSVCHFKALQMVSVVVKMLMTRKAEKRVACSSPWLMILQDSQTISVFILSQSGVPDERVFHRVIELSCSLGNDKKSNLENEQPTETLQCMISSFFKKQTQQTVSEMRQMEAKYAGRKILQNTDVTLALGD